MANIPVEKTGMGIWPWILGLLALVALIWLGLELTDDEPDADEIAGTEDNVGIIDDVEIGDDDDAEALMADADLYEPFGLGVYGAEVDVDEPTVLGADIDGDGVIETSGMAEDGTRMGDARIGRMVDFDDARVISVVGDSAFFIGTDNDRRVLVVLENLGESETGAGGTDGMYDINEGDRVSIDGTVARYAEGSRGTWELTDSDRERMIRQGLYVKVNSTADISVMSDSMD